MCKPGYSKSAFRIRIVGFLLLYGFLSFTAFAQSAKLDSLWLQYHNAHEYSLRLQVLNQISWASIVVDPELSMLYAEELLCLSEQTGIRAEEAAALNYLGVGYYLKGENETAITYYERAEKRANQLRDSITIAAVLNNQALLYVKLGIYQAAYQHFSLGAEMALQANNLRDYCSALNNIGATLEKMERYDEAVIPLRKAVSIAKEIHNHSTATFALGHLGYIAIQKQELDSAMYYYQTALDICEKHQDQIGLINVHIELARLYGIMNMPQKGLDILMKGEDLSNNLAFGEAMGRIYLVKAEIYAGANSHTEAIETCQLALNTLDRSHLRGLLPSFYEIMAESYASNRQYLQAYSYQKQYKLIHDSLYQDGQFHLIKSLENIHNEEQTAKENELLLEKQAKSEVTLKQRNSQIAAAIVIILLALIIALTSYQNYLRKKTLNEELERMVQTRTKELEESNKNLERFAHITSHDLKEPLRNITGFVQLLQRKLTQQQMIDKDISLYLDFIQTGTRQIKTLIEDVLSFTTVSKKEIRPHVLDLEELIIEIKGVLKPVLEESKAIISTDPLPTIYSVHSLLFVILKNLIENGIKYNKSSVPYIHISCQSEEHEIVISVKDNGIGIEAEYKTKIFELFERLHDRSEYEGSGLGLAICQKIAHQLGGQILVDSTPNEGSTFCLYLPKLEFANDPDKEAVSKSLVEQIGK